jgi:hypothetical protein
MLALPANKKPGAGWFASASYIHKKTFFLRAQRAGLCNAAFSARVYAEIIVNQTSL